MVEEMRPGKRIGHISVYYHNVMLVWGGYNDEPTTHYLPPEELWVYDLIVEKWSKRVCQPLRDDDDMPLGTSGGSAAVVNDYLYIFGGYTDDGNSNNLYRLNLFSFKWELMEPGGLAPTPCDKTTAWEHDGRLYIFGGYGVEPDYNERHRRQLDSQFLLDTNSHWHYRRGWNNQFACYDPVSNSWSWPEYKGFAPSPRAAHGAAKVGDKVYIFGGRHDTLRLNDLYVLDLRLMEWNGPLKVTDPSPEGRSWHSFTGISSDAAILYGGFSRDNEPLADCWMLSAPPNGSVKWSRVQLSFTKPRLWHTAVYTNLGDVLIFGGGVTNILNTELRDRYSGDVISIRFTPKSLLRTCLEVATNFAPQLRPVFDQLPAHMQKILQRRIAASPFQTAGS